MGFFSIFSRNDGEVGDPGLPKDDRGSGSFNQYAYDLIPRNAKVTMTLADAGPRQDALRTILESGEELETATGPRTVDQERTDAPIEVRLFAGSRVTPPVGVVPRGLEPVYQEALSRLEHRGEKQRIPARIVETKRGLRVELLMGLTR